ncbi:MAG: DUF4340 domain-containing protein [Leptospirales bacterium]|nr:DUF4340 domain-containing protein [Leptospirales bacterium]
MNKKLSVSAAVIVLLSAYLIARSCKAPSVSLKPVKAQPDYVLIQKGEDKLFFEREGKDWFINEVKYPADETEVDNFIERVKNLKLADLISNQPYYERFGLDAGNEMTIVLQKDGKVLRKVSVGSAAKASSHVFVRVDDKPEVYQTDDTFSVQSDMDAEIYRDKDICKIKQEDIVSLSISYNGKNFTFNRAPDEEASGKDKAGSKNYIWQSAELEGAELDKNKMSALVSSIASLRASKFEPSEAKPAREPIAKVFVKSDNGELALSVFPYDMKKNGGSEYLVISSESKYKFIVDEWKVQKLFIDDILSYKAPVKDEN